MSQLHNLRADLSPLTRSASDDGSVYMGNSPAAADVAASRLSRAASPSKGLHGSGNYRKLIIDNVKMAKTPAVLRLLREYQEEHHVRLEDIRDRQGRTLQQIAVEHTSCDPVIDYLAETAPSMLACRDKHNRTVFHNALIMRRSEGLRFMVVKLLGHYKGNMEAVAELLNSKDDEGCTPIHYARDSTWIKDWLRLWGATDDVVASGGNFAAIAGDDSKDDGEHTEWTLCHTLARRGEREELMANIPREQIPRSISGFTPAHAAAAWGHVHCLKAFADNGNATIRALLRKGCSYNWTPAAHCGADGATQCGALPGVAARELRR